MAVEVADRVLDVAITSFAAQTSKILHAGPANKTFPIDETPPATSEGYDETKHVIRLQIAVMGETTPLLSPLSVDIGDDPEFRIYRYDWLFGITLLNHERWWWDWKEKLRDDALAIHVILMPDKPGLGCTPVAAKLNVLPPSRDSSTWWEKHGDTVFAMFGKGAQAVAEGTAGVPIVAPVTKAIAAVSNSLPSQAKQNGTNWYIYQFLDPVFNANAVEWRISKRVLDEYGPLLRGTLVLAFHGDSATAQRPTIRLIVRPQIAFARDQKVPGDDLGRINPMHQLGLDQQVKLEITPSAA